MSGRHRLSRAWLLEYHRKSTRRSSRSTPPLREPTNNRDDCIRSSNEKQMQDATAKELPIRTAEGTRDTTVSTEENSHQTGVKFWLLMLNLGALMMPVQSTLLRIRTTFLGLCVAVEGTSTIAGSLTGGAIMQTIGWRWCLYTSLPIGGAMLLFTFFCFSEGSGLLPHTTDRKSALNQRRTSSSERHCVT